MAGSLQSAGNGMSSTTALVTDDGMTAADCGDHGEAKARSGEPTNGSSTELSRSHVRYAITHMYCMATTDTKAPDSFPGAFTMAGQLACLMEPYLTFDGQAHDITIAKATFQSCFAGDPNADEVIAGIPEAGIPGKLTAGLGSQNPINGTSGYWDGGMIFDLSALGMTLKIQLKDSDGVLAIGINSPPGDKTIPADAYVASIDKTNGVIRMEAKFQRIRTADGDGSNGWNRHTRIRIKGSVDDNFKFTKVDGVQGIYSSIWSGSTPTSALTQGFMWTLNGTDATGYASRYYPLATPASPELAASWTPVVNACNGKATSAATCTSTAPELTDAGTSYVMIPGASDFVNAEDWYAATNKLTYDTVGLTQ